MAPLRRQRGSLFSDTPYGELEFAVPVTQYSETKAYWDKPAVPLGANQMAWLPR